MFRREISIIITLLLLLPFKHYGQEDFKKDRHHYRLPERVTSSDYRMGWINVKVKPQFRDVFANPGLMDADVAGILKMLDIEESRLVVSERRHPKTMARLKSKPKYDINLYRQIKYNADIPLEQAINMLYETGIVEIAEPEYIQKIELQPDDSLLNRQYHLELIKAFEAWDVTIGDSAVVIAIVDSGVDVDHPDLQGSLWINPNDPVDGIDNDGNGYIDDIHGWDFAGALSGVNDEDNDPDITKGGGHQHGLSVASVAGAVVNNGIGFAGTGYQCRIMVTKHFADNQPEDALSYASNPYLGIIYAAENGADVINCSWGSTFRSEFNQDLINYVTMDLGALVVSSSGNSGLEEAHYPSDYDNVISVSAVDRSLKKSFFTTYGKGVDITAPGSAIAVLENGGEYGVTQGTSFSSPMVAGAAGLVKSVYPDFTGIQVGELLRVTANDTVYEINPSSTFRNKLGKGLLDMHKALTTQPPSIRMTSYKLLSSNGRSPAPGEDGFFVANFKNYLWASSGGLKVRLKSRSALLEVIEEESSLGIIEMGQSVTNTAHPFRIRIRENIPTNLKIDLILEYEDGEYTDYQFLTILLNPTFLNIEENQISTSIAENGRIGYQDTDQQEGIGFVYNDKNNLYEMGLMVGNSAAQVSSSVRSVDGTFDEDFVSTSRIADISPGLFSSAEITGAFNDSNAGDSASNVGINFRTMVWKESPDDHYFIVEYNVKNEGDSTLSSFYTGLYADWDISKSIDRGDGSNDRADWDERTSMGYIFNTDTTEQYYNGIQVLTGSPNYWAIDNNDAIEENPWGVYDGFEDVEKYESMSSGIGRRQAGIADEEGSDVSHTVAAGPYIIAPGDSITVAFAIHGTSSMEGLIASAHAADTMYNLTLKTAPPVLEDVDICYGDSAVIMASGASSFRWYRTKTGGYPFFEGSEFSTPQLFHDTTFYVANAENSWESVRTPVTVNIKANPEIVLSGSQFLCEGDTTTLLVEEADSYLWNPGKDTTQALRIYESGIYSVTVTYDSLGCISTSEEINILTYETPSASFVLDKEQIDRNIDTEITITDQSENTDTWFWKLSDGQTSTLQNPVFMINALEPVQVMLTATSPDGCQDQDVQIIDVITSLDPGDQLMESLEFYPNPSDGLMMIEVTNEYTGSYSVEIYNTTGRMVRDYEFSKTGNISKGIIDLNGLPDGIYLLRFEQDPLGHSTTRIILR